MVGVFSLLFNTADRSNKFLPWWQSKEWSLQGRRRNKLRNAELSCQSICNDCLRLHPQPTISWRPGEIRPSWTISNVILVLSTSSKIDSLTLAAAFGSPTPDAPALQANMRTVMSVTLSLKNSENVNITSPKTWLSDVVSFNHVPGVYVIINSNWPVIWMHSHLVERYPKQFFSRLLNLRHPLTQYGENVAGGSHLPHALVAARVKEGQFQSTAFRADGSVGNRMWNRYKSLLRLRKGAISQHLCRWHLFSRNKFAISISIYGPLAHFCDIFPHHFQS